jgi:uncharacterized membrane protein YjgN (DUF898 family)
MAFAQGRRPGQRPPGALIPPGMALLMLKALGAVAAVLTLGLYLPFAVVRNTRLNSAAMSVLMQSE